jgi:poly(hydroxyalkanoate) depolymerase family esterase
MMWEQLTFDGFGPSRPCRVYTPDAFVPGTAVPLVVMLHGCKQTPEDFAASTRMNQIAEQHGFIVLYPKQLSHQNRQRCWNWFSPEHQTRDQGEPTSIVSIVRELCNTPARWTIDKARIYVAGLSAGGAMAAILGATYPDVFAAIGIHSGVAYRAAAGVHAGLRAMRRGGSQPETHGQAAYAAMGARARVVPTIVFQGTDDFIVTPVNAEQLVQQWMEANRLASAGRYTAEVTRPSRIISGRAPRGRSYTALIWQDADGHEVQAYWRILGMGHAWSGGSYGGSYSDHRGPDAILALYQFFKAQALPRVAAKAPATMPMGVTPVPASAEANGTKQAALPAAAPSVPLWVKLMRGPSQFFRRLHKPTRT